MDPNLEWFQPEQRGPAQQFWSKCWLEFNKSCEKSSTAADIDNNLTKMVSKLSAFIPLANEINHSSTYDLDNNQHLIFKHKGTPWTKNSPYEAIDGLHQEIEDFFEYIKPKQKEHQIRLEVQNRITNIIEKLWPEAIVECFGSFKTNTYLPTSDIDLVVINHRWAYLPLQELEQQFLLTGQCLPTTIRVLDRAAVPIIKMTDYQTGIRINISFNMPQVVKSVNLVNEYIQEFPHLVKLLFVVKQFILQRDLNEVFKGGLSSYSLVLMVVHFFKTNPDCRDGQTNVNLGNLLMRFFELYGRTLNYEVVGLRVKEGIYCKKSEIFSDLENGRNSRHPPSMLCIQDPLNPNNNVSRSSYRIDKVRDAFNCAFITLYKAVGPNRSILANSDTILGRILRITDEVIERRHLMIERSYRFHQIPCGNQCYQFRANRGGHKPNRGNRGNRRNWNNNPWNNQNRLTTAQPQQNGSSSEIGSQQFQRRFDTNARNRNGFKRYNGYNNEANGGHYQYNNYQNPKFNHYSNQNYICYYSFDRNANQQKERANQVTNGNHKIKTPVKEVNGDKPDTNGSALKSTVTALQRRRSQTFD